MRNTRKSGQILRSKKRPRPTGKSGRERRTNSDTFHQIPARVIEAENARAVSIKLGGAELQSDRTRSLYSRDLPRPLWVKRRHPQTFGQCPLLPQYQTSG